MEGYGLNGAAVERLAAEGVKLIVTLDCGITSVAEVAAAARLGVDVVVVDHHTVPVDAARRRRAILNPHQPGCAYPSKHLRRGGRRPSTWSWRSAGALRERGRFGAARPEPNLREALDLVALGTVADVVPLVEVNRILVRFGLDELGKAARPGVRALLRVAGVADGRGHRRRRWASGSAPRINAAGRLDDAGRGVRLLSTADPAAADALAEELDRENRARQEIERQMLEEALADAAGRVAAGARGLVLSRPGWHPGVVGIVASRVVERFHRPAVLVGVSDGVGKGSGRSIEGFHLHDALTACAAHLARFGGHRHAAGVTIEPGGHPRLPRGLRAPRRLGRSATRTSSRAPASTAGWTRPSSTTGPRRTSSGSPPSAPGTPSRSSACAPGPSRARQVGAAGVPPEARRSADRDAIAFRLGRPAALCAGPVEAAVVARLRRLGRDAAAAAPGPRPPGRGAARLGRAGSRDSRLDAPRSPVLPRKVPQRFRREARVARFITERQAHPQLRPADQGTTSARRSSSSAGSTTAATTAARSSSTCATAPGVTQVVFEEDVRPEVHELAETAAPRVLRGHPRQGGLPRRRT